MFLFLCIFVFVFVEKTIVFCFKMWYTFIRCFKKGLRCNKTLESLFKRAPKVYPLFSGLSLRQKDRAVILLLFNSNDIKKEEQKCFNNSLIF